MKKKLPSRLLARLFFQPNKIFAELADTAPSSLSILFKVALWFDLLPPLFAYIGALKFRVALGCCRTTFLQIPKEESKINKNNKLNLVEAVEIREATKVDIISNDSSRSTTEMNLGEKVYLQHCASCHQGNGAGLPGAFPALIGNEAVLSDDPKQHIEIVLRGLKDKVIEGVAYAVSMPGFSAHLNDEEVAAVVNHERSSWGNNAPLISTKMVAIEREFN